MLSDTYMRQRNVGYTYDVNGWQIILLDLVVFKAVVFGQCKITGNESIINLFSVNGSYMLKYDNIIFYMLSYLLTLLSFKIDTIFLHTFAYIYMYAYVIYCKMD